MEKLSGLTGKVMVLTGGASEFAEDLLKLASDAKANIAFAYGSRSQDVALKEKLKKFPRADPILLTPNNHLSIGGFLISLANKHYATRDEESLVDYWIAAGDKTYWTANDDLQLLNETYNRRLIKQNGKVSVIASSETDHYHLFVNGHELPVKDGIKLIDPKKIRVGENTSTRDVAKKILELTLGSS